MAKDSLVLWEMFQHRDPALVGPTTSIPGLFYGPAWYYLALLPNILMGFAPFAGVLTVWILVLMNVYLLWRYVGRFEALLYVTSSGLIGSQQNAWVPYMTSSLMVPLLLLLLKIKPQAELKTRYLVLIALITSLLFHFQVAFAVVALPIVLFTLLYLKPKLHISHIFWAVLTFFSTLLPSLVFELKHNFLQTKSVVSFVQQFGTAAGGIEPNQTGLARVIEMGMKMLENAGDAVLPLHSPIWFGLIVIAMTYWYLRRRRSRTETVVVGSLLVGSFLFYLVLPIKTYYLVALFPVWVYAIGRHISQYHRRWMFGLVPLLLILSVVHAINQRKTYLFLADTTTSLYAPKVAAVTAAYQLANGQPFASYQFVPQVYDYTYQLIYLTTVDEGKSLPTEFSYAPGESSYNPYKRLVPSGETPDTAIFIIEKYVYPDVYEQWWQRVVTGYTIEQEIVVSEAITVMKAVKSK